MKNLNDKWAEEIRESIHNDVARMSPQEFDERTIAMARDIILPLIDKVSDPEWFKKNKNIDIVGLAVLRDGQPDMRRINRWYPELV